jgi:hypothetical protein
VGDYLIISPSEFVSQEYEYVQIKNINEQLITLNQTLKFFHYGSAETISTRLGEVDMRTSVGHLTRNIVIKNG